MEYLFRNIRNPFDAQQNTWHLVVIRNRIDHFGPGDGPTLKKFSVIDGAGLYVTPGFIDIHINGAGGSDVADQEPNSFLKIGRALSQHGVTAYLPTTFYDLYPHNSHLDRIVHNTNKIIGGSRILGLHLEGPYLNPEMKGGIPIVGIKSPADVPIDVILNRWGDGLKLMTIAPELPGTDEIIRMLKTGRCIPSFGHSKIDYEAANRVFSDQIKHVTHIFNAMPSLHHRDPGPLLAIINHPDVSVQLISDGAHVHPDMVKFIYRNIGAERIICITDGVQSIGMPESEYVFHGKPFYNKDGIARYSDNNSLIGASVPVGEIARRFMEFSGATFGEAIRTVTENPAKLLGLESDFGMIQKGNMADLNLIDHSFNVKLTMCDGKIIKNDI